VICNHAANDGYLVKLPDSIALIARIRYRSRANLTRVQRDEAYRALRESQQELLETAGVSSTNHYQWTYRPQQSSIFW
jgi:hypothetical protein